jgi:hypothetical protein
MPPLGSQVVTLPSGGVELTPFRGHFIFWE